MRIDKIEVTNLASIEGTQTVDFTLEPLRSAGLFAITGNTGAGKSTLLDAVCLALYGHAPRFEITEKRPVKLGLETEDDKHALAADDVRNILRRGCSEGGCKVTFSLTDGTVYEAGWSVRVKRTGMYDKPVRSLRKLKPHKENYDSREVAGRIVNLTHLTYEQFTRTVILAQNGFANFLNAKQADKSLLLEKLTGTELFGNISQKVFVETQEAKRRFEDMKKRIEGISTRLLNDDDLAREKNRLTMCQGQQTRDLSALDRITKQLDWYDRYHKAQVEMEKQKTLFLQAQRDYNALYDRKQTLDRYDKVQVFRELFHKIKEAESELETLKTQVTLKSRQLREERERMGEAKNNYKQALASLEEVNAAYRHKESHFNRGHDLQGQISAIETEVKHKREDLERYTEDIRKHNEQLVKLENQRDSTTRHKEDTIQQLQSIAMHRNMVENVESVKVQLEKMHELQEDTKACQKQLAELRGRLNMERDNEKHLNEEQNRLQAEAKSLKEELFIHSQANQGQSGADIQRRLNRLSDTHRRAKGALELWKRLTEGYSEIEEKADEIRRRERFIEQINRETDTNEKRLGVLNEALEVLRKSYMLSQSENIIELRQNLKEGLACPVCGATHHPYHSETEQELGRILSTLEEDFLAAEAEANSARDMLLEKQKQLAEEIGQLTQSREELKRLQRRQRYNEGAWKDFEDMDASLHGCSASVNRENRATVIGQLNENASRELGQVQQLMETFNQHQEAINDINTRIRKADEVRTENVRRLSEVNTNVRVLDSQINELQNRIGRNAESQDMIEGKLDAMVTIPLWHEKWRKNYENLVQQIIGLAETWNDGMATCKKADEDVFRLNEEINTLMQWVSEKNGMRSALTNGIASKEQEIKHKRDELFKMFGEVGLDEVMRQMKLSIERHTSEEQTRRLAFEDVLNKVQGLEGEMRNLEAQQHRREDDLHQNHEELDIRISRFNNDNSTLQYFELEKLFTDPRDWNALRREVSECQERLQTATFSSDAASKVLVQLQQDENRPSEKNEESELMLQHQKEQYEQHFEEVKAQMTETQTVLRMHEQSRKDIDACEPERQELQTEYENWLRLNAIIGSKDGKLFREIAQCYTFEVLVGYANRHLRDLTDRYRLRCKPGTLMLEIIDHDMLDEVRSVSSLSGGETFIVSLGLALGLSSLRSGEMQISSLFIDEGFGNLDSNSLDMVINALASLQGSQGRKVGIISHTEQVRHRITPQVRLVKCAGAKSRIEVK
jgi:DNA repair exonuclease SbcCD ATPase subunit